MSNIFEIAEVDPIIIFNFKQKLKKSKNFSYRDNDHLKQAKIDEKRMRKNENDRRNKTTIRKL